MHISDVCSSSKEAFKIVPLLSLDGYLISFNSRNVFPVGLLLSCTIYWYSRPTDQRLPDISSYCHAWRRVLQYR